MGSEKILRKLKDIQTLIQEKVFRKKSVEKIVYNDNVITLEKYIAK